MYFITICTYNREHFLGNIENGIVHLSEIGEIVYQYWYEIPIHFPFTTLGEFIVMPNHVHGIIIINKNDENTNSGMINNGGGIVGRGGIVETPKLGVSTPTTITTKTTTTDKTKRTNAASNQWKPGNLGVIINQFKRKCTIDVRKLHEHFAWQSRFYDHIIRNDESFQKISNYIISNPKNWHDDKFYHSC